MKKKAGEEAGEKWKSLDKKERKGIVMLTGSQASPVRPSDRGVIEVKTLGWLETGAARIM
jgi:hypothetical protein